MIEDILLSLDKLGFECNASFISAKCCGDYHAITFGDQINGDHFNIHVKDDKYYIIKLQFDKIVISYGEFDSAEKLVEFIKRCKEINV